MEVMCARASHHFHSVIKCINVPHNTYQIYVKPHVKEDTKYSRISNF